jgi:hypothetical protein
MSKEWIIEVLGDLRGFASMNGLPELALQLEEACVVAAVEIAQTEAGASAAGPDGTQARRVVGETREG